MITPILDVAAANNTTITIPFVAPRTTYSEKIYMWNFTAPGSFVERFLVRYSQGTNEFTTIFPCLADFLTGADSLVSITNLGNSKGSVFVNFTNDANYSIAAMASVYAPPSFAVSPPSSNATLQPHGNATLSFRVNPPQITNAEFPIAVGVSYVRDGVHYATLAVTSVTFASAPGATVPQLGGTLLVLALLLTIIIIIILIIISVIISRDRKKKQHSSNPDPKSNT